jgi:hypothetical protein
MVLFALALTAIILGVGIVVDGGFAYAQRRVAQNAADFAAMAGTRIVGSAKTGRPAGAGIATHVREAIDSVIGANGAQLVSARYVDVSGTVLGDVATAGTIPGRAFGVVVEARTNWRPFLLGIIGISDWVATASATARTPGDSYGGGVLPVGIQDSVYDDLEACPLRDLTPCINQNLTSGRIIDPGNFGWLSFGLGEKQNNKCGWDESLNMDLSGCEKSKTFLDSHIGPPQESQRCSTAVGNGGEERIGALTGNEWGDLSWYIDNQVPVWVPIWSGTGPKGGANAYYDIVGFGAIIFTGDNTHAKWLKGAASENACKKGTEIEDAKYCSEPGGEFIVAATGAVQLVR